MTSDPYITIAETLKEVESRTAEELRTTNSRSSDPGLDLQVWQRIATVYSEVMEKHPEYTLRQKETVYGVLLRLTMAIDCRENSQAITPEEVDEIESAFSAASGFYLFDSYR